MSLNTVIEAFNQLLEDIRKERGYDAKGFIVCYKYTHKLIGNYYEVVMNADYIKEGNTPVHFIEFKRKFQASKDKIGTISEEYDKELIKVLLGVFMTEEYFEAMVKGDFNGFGDK